MASRTLKSVRNVLYAFISHGITSIVTFITRTIFIYMLGKEYLGLNGLFSDILILLSLAELGIGTAITYSMYKPIAENDKKKIAALLKLYKKVYQIIGCLVTIIGISLIPFLRFFISDIEYISNVNIIYLLYLMNTTLSYFFVYKKSILIANQDMHIISKIQTIINILQNVIQVIILILFKNFIYYLIVQVIFGVLNNLLVSIHVDKHFPYLKEYENEKVDEFTKKEILKSVIGMFFSKVSSAIVTSTDNILISKYVSTIVLGYYSNYTLFITFIRQIFNKVFESITGSVGNLLATESNKKSNEVFELIYFLNFWLISMCSIMFFVLINKFINIWIGEGYQLNIYIVFFISLNLYMRFIRNTCLTYIDSYGLFWNIKWKCICEALLNLISSLIYLKVFKLGILGVLLGTFTSNILTNFWYEPYIIYTYKFKLPVRNYFLKFVKYFIVTIITGILTFLICENIVIKNNILDFILDIVICIFVINILYILLFRNEKEFNYLKIRANNIIKRYNVKLKAN